MVLCAQTQLTNITTNNNSGIVFSFSSLPAEVSSELSDDKKRIAITFANTIAANKLHDELPTTDQVEHIAVQQKDKALTVYIILRDKYGFTQVALPYSRTVQVSIVQWDKLPPRDNLYHSGLLSLDSKLHETALDYLQQASQKGSGNAAAIAGLIALQHGDIEKAQTNFTRAIDIGTSIHDVYAAISDIAAARGDTQRAQHFAQLFTRKTRLPSFVPLVPAILANTSEVLEPRTLAQSLLSGDVQPSLPVADSAAAPDSTAADTLLNQQVSNQAQALVTTTRDEGTASSPSFVPSWMQWAVYGFLFVFCTGFVGILYLYLRWRKKRLRSSAAPTDSTQSPTFEQEMASALQTAQAKRASSLYKQAGTEGINTEERDEELQDEELSPANDISNGEARTHAPLYANQEQELSDIEHPTPLRDTAMAQQPTDADEVDTLARKLRKGRGELDLAVKLLARKKQDGQGKALEISADDIPEKPSHLARFAQKLGIGAGLLEMRRQLGTTRHNEKEEKLRSLFDTSNREE